MVSGCAPVNTAPDSISTAPDTFDTTGTSTETDDTSSTSTSGTDLSASTDTTTSTSTTADSSTSTSDLDTSTGPDPACGDGVLDPELEECDDANLDDTDDCTSLCTRVWTVFITSNPGTQGDLKGMVGAEYECRHRAVKAGLKNGDRYLPWLSTSTSQPRDRFHHARGPYRRVDGVQIAADWHALTSNTLENPILIDETGALHDTVVFTGTHPNGTRVAASDHCDDWTTISGKKKGWIGDAAATNTDWSRGLESICGGGGALYCFEQP